MHSSNIEPNAKSATIDIDTLQSSERVLRDRVDASPESADARRDLAWCLLMQVFVRCGFEDCMSRLASAQPTHETLHVDSISHRTIKETLAECLFQATVVPSVADDAVSRIESERLIALARLAGHSELVDDAQRRHDHVMRVLIRDLENGEEHSDSHERLKHKSTHLHA